jgi:hypothetical protein
LLAKHVIISIKNQELSANFLRLVEGYGSIIDVLNGARIVPKRLKNQSETGKTKSLQDRIFWCE